MLILSRFARNDPAEHRIGKDSVSVDGPCVVTVIRMTADTVWLGFTADDGTRILRTEILDRKPEGAA